MALLLYSLFWSTSMCLHPLRGTPVEWVGLLVGAEKRWQNCAVVRKG